MFDPDNMPLQEQQPEEDQYQQHRPTTFQEYHGQDHVKEKLSVYTQAACKRQEPVDHILLLGPPGLGKTTLAHIIAHTCQAHIKVCSGPTLERTGDLVAILSGLYERDILFIDEIHRLPSSVEEMLYSAMEQFQVDVIIGQGAGAKSVTLPLRPFTLIGATTKSGMISAPLRTRFGIIERLSFYEPHELATIIQSHAQQLQVTIDDTAADILARAARGTPRTARKLLRRSRDIAEIHSNGHISNKLAEHTLSLLEIDHHGLTAIDRTLMHHIDTTYSGGPVGIDTLASIVSEDSATLEDVYEPFLIRQGFIEKTPRGRRIPPAMREYVKRILKHKTAVQERQITVYE